MSHFIYCYAECHYAERRYAECRYAEYASVATANFFQSSLVFACKVGAYPSGATLTS